MRGPIRVASWPMQSGEISSSIASLAEATARKPKVSPQPSNPLSVVTLTSSESAAGRFLSPQAEASDLLPALNGTRSGKVSIPVMITSAPLGGSSSGPYSGRLRIRDFTHHEAGACQEHH